MVIFRFYLYFILAAFTGFSSCTNQKQNDPKPDSQLQDPALTTKLLTAAPWQLASLTHLVPGTAIKDDLFNNALAACRQDDRYKFATSGNSLTIEAGNTFCGTASQPEQGSWVLKNAVSLSVLAPSLTQAGLTGDFEISELTNSRLVLLQKDSNSEYVVVYERPQAPVNERLLTGKKWRLSAYTISENNAPARNFYDSLRLCERDNLLRFSPNKTYSYDEGSRKCDPTDPQVFGAGTWQFSPDQSKLILNNTYQKEITELTATTLSFVEIYTFGGTLYVNKFTYTGL